MPRRKEMPEKCRDAHGATFKNWRLLKKSKMCGCIYCCEVYPASEVVDWCDELDRRRTALCPHCGIDSVIPDASGWPLDPEFLKEMKYWWFEANPRTLKVSKSAIERLNALCRKLDFLHKVLPGGSFAADSDGSIRFLGIFDKNSKSRLFPDLKKGSRPEEWTKRGK